MPSVPFSTQTSTYIVLEADDIDTDQIIPARFLTTTERDGLGKYAFADWRYDNNNIPTPSFPMNHKEKADAKILVVGNNFGCGSSREHAVWALMSAGFSAIISTQFADIFRGNALGNGLLPVTTDQKTIETLIQEEKTCNTTKITVNLENTTLTLPDGSNIQFKIEPFARKCLLKGADEMDILMESISEIERWEQSNISPVNTLAEANQ